MTPTVQHSRGFRGCLAPLPVQFFEALAEVETEPLSALASVEVGDLRLGAQHPIGDFPLAESATHQVANDLFPHSTNNSIRCCFLQTEQQHLLAPVLLSCEQNAPMEIEDIRRLRLRQWIDADPVSRGNVEKWCAYYTQRIDPGEAPLNPSYIRQLAPEQGKANRNIGERSARRLERIGGKPRGWLDVLSDSANPPVEKPLDIASARHVITADVVQAAITGVLASFGLRLTDFVEDIGAARKRLADALLEPDEEIVRARYSMGHVSAAAPVARATRNSVRMRYPGEVSPDLDLDTGEPEFNSVRERRS